MVMVYAGVYPLDPKAALTFLNSEFGNTPARKWALIAASLTSTFSFMYCMLAPSWAFLLVVVVYGGVVMYMADRVYDSSKDSKILGPFICLLLVGQSIQCILAKLQGGWIQPYQFVITVCTFFYILLGYTSSWFKITIPKRHLEDPSLIDTRFMTKDVTYFQLLALIKKDESRPWN